MLTTEEQRKLVNIIESLYDFTDGGLRGRRILLQQAGLRSYVSTIDLSGPPHIVAQDIVGRLETKGYLVPERPTFHALGALLSYIITLTDLQREQASFIAQLIIRYSLVHDQEYLDDLRERYNISAISFQPSVPIQSLATPVPYMQPMPPNFDITLSDKQWLERVIDTEDNFLDVYMLAGAIYSTQAVCQIERRDGIDVKNKALGTGFLIGPDLLLTNQHVVEDQEYLTEIVAHFDYRIDANGVPLPGRVVEFQPSFYFSSDPSLLDYAMLRLKEQPLQHMVLKAKIEGLSYLNLLLQGKHRGYLVLAERFLREKYRINVIQHPDGRPMKVVLTHNYVSTDMTDTRVHYIADTMDGSSGAPVFNQSWEVVALHHSGKPYPPDTAKDTLKKAWKGYFHVNEGIPIRALLKDFRARGLDRHLPNGS